MTKRRFVGVLLFGGVWLAVGVVPAGAAPAASPAGPTVATLSGPNSRPCNGLAGTDPVGTASIQSGTPAGAGTRALRVNVAANKVRGRITYDVVLATTVRIGPDSNGNYAVGCQYWSAGTTTVPANGKLAFTGAVNVPSELLSFQVYVGPVQGPSDVGYTTPGMNVSGL